MSPRYAGGMKLALRLLLSGILLLPVAGMAAAAKAAMNSGPAQAKHRLGAFRVHARPNIRSRTTIAKVHGHSGSCVPNGRCDEHGHLLNERAF